MKLQAFDSSYFHGKSYFEDDDMQTHQPVDSHFKKIANSNHISVWKSKGFPDENIKPPAASNNNSAPA